MSEKNYKDTLNLPKTDFPMKANLSVRENDILDLWEQKSVYKKSRENSNGKSQFILHDGPPFANGNIHLGHVLNKTLKDIVVRYKTMRGFDVPYVPGWDCHGLPIEHKVVQELSDEKKIPIIIRKRSQKYAEKYIDIQKKQFKRLGIWGEWDKPYITMTPSYEAEELRGFASLVEKDMIYQGLRPVYWSTGCQTALAEAEIEYQDRTDSSIYVKFKLLKDSIKNLPEKLLGQIPENKLDNFYLVVWTTTPWTLPANLATAVHPDLNYSFLSVGDEVWIIASSLATGVLTKSGKGEADGPTLKGRELEGVSYQHPFLDRTGNVYVADFVTEESGSGIVHIAPGHGHDDYSLGQKNNLDVLSPVDDEGRLTDECGVKEWVGEYVFDSNSKVISLLQEKNLLIYEEAIHHSYPHCWRSKTPIVFRSVKQWFIRVNAFRDKALDFIEEINWIPDWGKNRIQGSVSTRQDWCISRQRTWGVPIPVFYDENNTPKMDPELIRKFADIVEEKGTNVWFESSDEDLSKMLELPSNYRKGTDTLDVWIDSGSSAQAVVKKQLRFPADLYLEGSDQHRGWFQSSLLLSSAITGERPFHSVLTHGFVVDGEGKKMSKSLGNVVSPEEITSKLGSDILRLWVVSSDFSDDIRVSKDIFNRVSDTYRKFRNTFRYMLGNLSDFDFSKNKDFNTSLLFEEDRWALSRCASLVDRATQAYEAYHYHRFYQDVYNFCIRDLSSIYFDVLKDRLYVDAKDSISGKSARWTLQILLQTLTKLLAPVLPFTCEEVWQHMISNPLREESVHLSLWPQELQSFYSKDLDEKWVRLLSLRENVLKALEDKREKKEIGNSLGAEVELTVFKNSDNQFYEDNLGLLKRLLLVSDITIKFESSERSDEVDIKVLAANGDKCQRCWIYSPQVGQDSSHPTLCVRCIKVVDGKGSNE